MRSSTTPVPMPASATAAAPAPHRRQRRAILFRAVAVLLVVFVLTGPGGLASLVAPVMLVGADASELHRWHSTGIAALAAVLVAGALLLALRAPGRRPVLIQAVLTAVMTLGLFTVALPPHPTVALVPVGIIGGLILASYPNLRGVASVRPHAARRPAVLVTTLAAAPALLFDAVENIGRQVTDGSEHALLGHWSGAAALATALLLCGLLAATGRPGWRQLTGLLAAAFGYLGVAALLLPDHDGSWGAVGGVLALLVASAYAVIVARAGATPRRW